MIISTGSQGEPLSALRRMAHNDHRMIELQRGDTVVFSATPIPGNERAVNETSTACYHIGCEVITPREAPVHASGHGYAEELKLMLNLVKPRYVMPVHGDYKRIRLHAELAEAVGIDPEDVFQGENGLPLEIDARSARFGERRAVGHDLRRRRRHRRPGRRRAARPPDALRRRDLHRRRDGRPSRAASRSCRPEVIFRGVPFVEQADEPASRRSAPRSSARWPARPATEIREIDMLQQELHDDLAAFVYDRLRRRPMVLPVVVEV